MLTQPSKETETATATTTTTTIVFEGRELKRTISALIAFKRRRLCPLSVDFFSTTTSLKNDDDVGIDISQSKHWTLPRCNEGEVLLRGVAVSRTNNKSRKLQKTKFKWDRSELHLAFKSPGKRRAVLLTLSLKDNDGMFRVRLGLKQIGPRLDFWTIKTNFFPGHWLERDQLQMTS